MAEIDYDSIKTEYLTTNVSFATLGRKYGLDRTSISRKAKKDKWDEEKARMRNEAHEAAIKSTIDAQVSISETCMEIVTIMTAKIKRAAEICDPEDTKMQRDIMAMVDDLNQMGAFAFDGATSRNNITVEFIGMDDSYGV